MGLDRLKNFGIDLAFPTLSARAKIKTNEFVTGNYSYEIVNRLTSFLHAKKHQVDIVYKRFKEDPSLCVYNFLKELLNGQNPEGKGKINCLSVSTSHIREWAEILSENGLR